MLLSYNKLCLHRELRIHSECCSQLDTTQPSRLLSRFSSLCDITSVFGDVTKGLPLLSWNCTELFNQSISFKVEEENDLKDKAIRTEAENDVNVVSPHHVGESV